MNTVQAIGTLILRVIALFLIIRWLPWAMIFASSYFQPPEMEAVQAAYELRSLAYASVIVLSGVLLLALSRPIARLIAPHQELAPESTPLSAEDMISVGTFLLGVVLLSIYLPDVLMEISQAAVARMRDLDAQYVGYLRSPWMAAERAVMLFLGFWLLLRPASLARLYSWLRTAGLAKEEAAGEEAAKPE